jgi:fused signal recognition particle receptor
LCQQKRRLSRLCGGRKGRRKGGVLVALADKFGLPIHAIGVGEQIDDLSPFDPAEFARALVGLEAA